jgi:hypothetical protein
MTKQNIKLTIFFILGLPALPIACVMWLMNRYIFDDKNQSKELFISFMLAATVFFGAVGLLLFYVKK